MIKKMVTAILLLFVAGSIGFLVVSETRKSPPEESRSAVVASSSPNSRSTAALTRAVAVAYYFHGTMRCPTCLKIERLARGSIEDSFAAELEAGLIEWRSVDYDHPDNAHFVKEYGLSASALVLVAADRKPETWQKLDRTWELVEDEAAFKAYVADAVATVLRGES